ncbi:hypothetical protein VKT23_006670 [Stygiomarasmius scandens]|uniref:Uncharacterized protein n=1 Tax=Marasmiellus scandens TaxID=2682957 RepID=A0ABR1JUS1_9AGAR
MTLQHWTFDDRDTEYLHYHPKGRWTLDGTWNASSVTDNPTGTLAWTNDLNATVKFTFPSVNIAAPANAFYYYGMKRSNGGLYAICIDCDPYKPQYTFIDALDTQDKGDGLPVLLFARKFLDYGIHEIILENRNDTRVFHSGNSQLSIDRIIRRSKPNTGSLLIPNSRSFLLNPYGTVQPTARDVEKLPKHKISAQEIISTRKVKLPPHGVLRSSRSRNPLFTSAQASTVRNDNLTVQLAHLPTALSLNNTVTDSGYPRQRPILIM